MGSVRGASCGVKSKEMRWGHEARRERTDNIYGHFRNNHRPNGNKGKTRMRVLIYGPPAVHKFCAFWTSFLPEPKTQLFSKSYVLGSAKRIFFSTFWFMRILGS